MGFPLQVKTYANFGGLKQNISETNLGADNAIIAQNCRFRQTGAVRHCDGYSKFYSEPIEASPILGLYHFKYSGSDTVIGCAGEYIYSDINTETKNELIDVQSDEKYYSFCTLNGFCYIVNGDTNLKYNGTDISNISISNPTTNPSATASTTGGYLPASSTYGYLITFVNGTTFQESNPYSLTSFASVTTGSGTSTNKITLSNIPVSTDTQVNQRNIYRTTANGSIYDAQYLNTINDNTTTTYSDDSSKTNHHTDLELGDTIQLFHDPAPASLVKVVTHKNKVFGFVNNSTLLYISYDYNGWYWPVGTFGDVDFSLEINKDDGEYITDIVSFLDYLIIFKTNSIWVLEGYDETDFYVRKINYDTDVGCINPRASIVKNNLVYFIDKKGIYVTDGSSIKLISGGVQGYFNDDGLILDLPIDKSKYADACCGVDTALGNKVIKFSFCDTSDTTNTPNLHLIYDYELDVWSVDKGYNATSYCKYDTDGEEYLLRGDDLGYVYQESSSSYDDAFYEGTITTALATNTSLIDANTNPAWSADKYNGCYVIITSGNNIGERRRILDTTTDTLTLDSAWEATDEVGTSYIIGTREFIYISGWDDYGNPGYSKRLKSVRPRIDCMRNYSLDLFNWYDFKYNMSDFRTTSVLASLTYDVPAPNQIYWDDEWYWGTSPIQEVNRETQISSIHKYHSYGIRCYNMTAGVILNNYDKIFQIKGIGKK